MKRLVLLAALVSAVFTAAAVAAPAPSAQFHSAKYHYAGANGDQTVWVRVDNVPYGGKTHLLFRTYDLSGTGEIAGDHCGDGADYVAVNDYPIVMDHQDYALVPVVICGESSTIVPGVSSNNDSIGLELYSPSNGTHLGRSHAKLISDI